MVKTKEMDVIVFYHDDFDGTGIYYLLKEHLFQRIDNTRANETAPEENRPSPAEEQDVELPSNIFHTQNCPEIMNVVRNQGLNVDYDNDPLPKNIPPPPIAIQTNNEHNQEYGWDVMCNQATTSVQSKRLYIIGIHEVKIQVISLFVMFLLSPAPHHYYLENDFCKLMSEVMSTPLLFGELLRYLGI